MRENATLQRRVTSALSDYPPLLIPLRFYESQALRSGTPQLPAISSKAIRALLIAKPDLSRSQAQAGAVALIQRFGGALNLNIHFHMIFLDGIYDVRRADRPGASP